MSKPKKPKGDMLDRQLAALVKLRRTKHGRQIVDDCREGILACLAEGAGKP